jgi:hypothetical protein
MKFFINLNIKLLVNKLMKATNYGLFINKIFFTNYICISFKIKFQEIPKNNGDINNK